METTMYFAMQVAGNGDRKLFADREFATREELEAAIAEWKEAAPPEVASQFWFEIHKANQ